MYIYVSYLSYIPYTPRHAIFTIPLIKLVSNIHMRLLSEWAWQVKVKPWPYRGNSCDGPIWRAAPLRKIYFDVIIKSCRTTCSLSILASFSLLHGPPFDHGRQHSLSLLAIPKTFLPHLTRTRRKRETRHPSYMGSVSEQAAAIASGCITGTHRTAERAWAGNLQLLPPNTWNQTTRTPRQTLSFRNSTRSPP